MEQDQEQYWTRWKGSDKPKSRMPSARQPSPEGEIQLLPEKSQAVLDFEGMSFKEKEKVRASPEWPGIAEYYDKVWEITQENHAVYHYRMKTGQMPIGTVPYLHGLQVSVCHRPTPPEGQWMQEPGRTLFHRPRCPYRLEGWQNRFLCDCYPSLLRGKKREPSKGE